MRDRFLRWMVRGLSLCVLWLLWSPSLLAAEGDLDRALDAFWQAEKALQQEAAIAEILELKPNFDTLLERLRQGRPYEAEVPTGRLLRTRTGRFHYKVLVPEDYDPARRYAVHFLLHGGVGRPAWRRDGSWWRDDAGLQHPDRISVFPAAWDSAKWWYRNQGENLPGILQEVKRTYNVDENRVHLIGISDGATGAYFHAFRNPNPWAAFLPFIGHAAVLANPRSSADGQLHVINLSNRSFLAINGGVDRLYPTRSVLPFLDLFARHGAEVEFVNRPESGHSVSWLPEERQRIQTFIDKHPREPLPNRIAWETETTDRYHRLHWLLIRELSSDDEQMADSSFEETNTLRPPPVVPVLGAMGDPASQDGVRLSEVRPRSVARAGGLRQGDIVLEVGGEATPTIGRLADVLEAKAAFDRSLVFHIERRGQRQDKTLRFGPRPEPVAPKAAFPLTKPSGRVDLEVRNNRVDVRTRGIKSYELLLSPDQFDFQQPITVVTNGKISYQGHVVRDTETLLRWASRDQDRTMLFAAALTIEVTGSAK